MLPGKTAGSAETTHSYAVFLFFFFFFRKGVKYNGSIKKIILTGYRLSDGCVLGTNRSSFLLRLKVCVPSGNSTAGSMLCLQHRVCTLLLVLTTVQFSICFHSSSLHYSSCFVAFIISFSGFSHPCIQQDHKQRRCVNLIVWTMKSRAPEVL